MTLRTDLLLVEDACLGILVDLDQCPSQVTIITRTWSGGQKDVGDAADATLALPKRILVRQLTTREIANSGGRYEEGDLLLDCIVPTNGSVGYTEAQLAPRVTSEAIEVIYQVTGQHAGQYALQEMRTADPYVWQLVIGRKRDKALVTTP